MQLQKGEAQSHRTISLTVKVDVEDVGRQLIINSKRSILRCRSQAVSSGVRRPCRTSFQVGRVVHL